MYCIKCGTKNPNDAVFCMKCGKRITGELSQTEKLQQRSDEAQADKTIRRKKAGGILIFGFLLFVPLILLLAFFYPVGIGYLWVAIMLFVALRFKLKKTGDWKIVLIILLFFGLMATSTDLHGNFATHFVLKKLYFEPYEELLIEKNVYHSKPGSTSVTYRKYRIKQDGSKEQIGSLKVLFASAITYFSLSILLLLLNIILSFFRRRRQPFGPPDDLHNAAHL
ncbi:zinc-ribbon domain-containing protein [Candidatus Dependentiae bacterium]|nr:zinc-ribbon domain-containing protein [Candidatus Dependentiae bacterium]